MIERNHLTIIEHVDRLGTLTEAANALCLTQSALSHAIRKLESQLGTEIWRKEGRQLCLTEAGGQLLQLAHRVLPQFAHVERVIDGYADGLRGTLRVGMECHPCYEWLLKVVAPYLKAYPDVDVELCKSVQFAAIGALLAHEIDVLITPDPLEHKRLEYIPVLDYEHVLVVAGHHTLAGREYIEPGQLANQILLTYPVETSRLDIFKGFLTPAGTGVRQHKEVETTEIMLQMVSAGRGVAALPRWLVQEQNAGLGLVPVRLGQSGLHKTLYLGFRAEASRPGYQQQFIELALQVAAGEESRFKPSL